MSIPPLSMVRLDDNARLGEQFRPRSLLPAWHLCQHGIYVGAVGARTPKRRVMVHGRIPIANRLRGQTLVLTWRLGDRARPAMYFDIPSWDHTRPACDHGLGFGRKLPERGIVPPASLDLSRYAILLD